MTIVHFGRFDLSFDRKGGNHHNMATREPSLKVTVCVHDSYRRSESRRVTRRRMSGSTKHVENLAKFESFTKDVFREERICYNMEPVTVRYPAFAAGSLLAPGEVVRTKDGKPFLIVRSGEACCNITVIDPVTTVKHTIRTQDIVTKTDLEYFEKIP